MPWASMDNVHRFHGQFGPEVSRLCIFTLMLLLFFCAVYNNDVEGNYRPIIDNQSNTLMQATSLIIVFIPSLSILAVSNVKSSWSIFEDQRGLKQQSEVYNILGLSLKTTIEMEEHF